MKNEDIITTLEEATGTTTGSLQAETMLAEVLGWDSMGKLEFLAMIDEKFDLRLPEGAIIKVVSVGDLCAAVKNASAS